MRKLIDAIRNIFDPILHVFRGIAIVIDEDRRSDPECWDHPARKRRYRRRMRREAESKNNT